MKLTLFFDHRFRQDGNGRISSPTSYNYELFAARYLQVFDELRIVARVKQGEATANNSVSAEGPGVTIRSAGDWQGPLGYFKQHRQVSSIVQDELASAEAIIMIAPGRVGQLAASSLIVQSRPYGVEVVGDPYDIFAPGNSSHPLRPFLRRWGSDTLRRQTSNAASVAWVSSRNLPDRYPAAPGAFSTNYSSIELRPEHIVDRPRKSNLSDRPARLVTIGTMSQMYKGIDVLIDAVSILHREGRGLHLTVIGDGRYRVELEARAATAGIGELVQFMGHLPAGDPVRTELDRADVFVLASRTEGLPRSMIEAMARGLPCIGTNVGGIPDLLPPELTVDPGDAPSLARKIDEVLQEIDASDGLSVESLETANAFRADVLQERRNAMYSHLLRATSNWMSMNGGEPWGPGAHGTN